MLNDKGFAEKNVTKPLIYCPDHQPVRADHMSAKNHLSYVFVHGLSGWGSYDAAYRKMPYWGMRGGDLIVF